MVIEAKYDGTCPTCGHRIAVGERIEWSKGAKARHAKCPQTAGRVAPAAASVPEKAQEVAVALDASAEIKLDGGSGYGCQGWQVGQVLLNPERIWGATNPTAGDGPEGLVVLTANSRYYREDGMSFGAGDEQGRVYWATARPATDAELAPLLAERTAETTRRQAAVDFVSEFERIFKDGERPEKAGHPAGEILVVDRSPYARQSIVVATDWIWALRYNGSDGDCWAWSNCGSSIGARVPLDPELAARLRALAAAAGKEAR